MQHQQEAAGLKIFRNFLFLGGFFFMLMACESPAAPENSPTKSTVSAKQSAIRPAVKMVKITGGKYLPFYGDSSLVEVHDFLLDERPVTNREFLDFVKKNPKWKRSAVNAIYADETYLKNWQDDESLPENADPEAAVTFVSWFAAKAYAKAAGKRLPTLDEWEYVAMADEESPNAREKESYSAHLINLYNKKFREREPVKHSKPNYHGIYNMFDLVWEWTDDFNSVMTTSDSRSGEFDDKGLFCAAAATSAADILNYASFMRFAYRSSLKAAYTVENLGFRCAKDLPKN